MKTLLHHILSGKEFGVSTGLAAFSLRLGLTQSVLYPLWDGKVMSGSR